MGPASPPKRPSPGLNLRSTPASVGKTMSSPEVARLDAVIALRDDDLERLNASHERQAARSALSRTGDGLPKASSPVRRPCRTVPGPPGRRRTATSWARRPTRLLRRGSHRLPSTGSQPLSWPGPVTNFGASSGGLWPSLRHANVNPVTVCQRRRRGAPNADYAFGCLAGPSGAIARRLPSTALGAGHSWCRSSHGTATTLPRVVASKRAAGPASRA